MKEKGSWVKDLSLSPEDDALATRMDAGENVDLEILSKRDHFKYSVEPYGLSDIAKNPEAYQKLFDDIDAAIKKNILEWGEKTGSDRIIIRPRKVRLGGSDTLQCKRCTRLNAPYCDYCCFCGAKFH
jgi:hypothetical protein